MAQSEGGQERTEEATPKRLREAKEKGQVARSRELTTLILLLTAGFGLLFLGGAVVSTMARIMTESFQFLGSSWQDASSLPEILLKAMLDSLWALAPILLLFFVVALLAPGLLGGWLFSGDAIAFKWERIDPIKGLGKIFSWRGLLELIKAIAKFVLVAIVAGLWLWSEKWGIIGLGNQSIESALRLSADVLIWSFVVASVPLVLIAAPDVFFQKWDHSRQLKMTRQEVREENKDTEGNPEIKAKIKVIQRELARRRMMEEVPKADVIITNPTHYSVALKYDQHKMGAPVVVAKGADLIALQIRNVATLHNVPIVTAPPLARAVYFSTDLNKEVPAGLYLAVAQILAYVYQLKNAGGKTSGQANNFDDLPIPDDMRVDER